MKKKYALWLFLVYAIACHLPFFVPALNQLEPSIIGIPFTVWSIHVVMLLCCLLLYWLSKNVWDTYDGGEEG